MTNNPSGGGLPGLVPPGHIDDGTMDMFSLQCFPLYSLMVAVGNPTVNFLSLDIEGAEFEVRTL